MKDFKPYNKQELLNQIKAITIFREGETVVTKFHDRVVNVTPVSKRYEVFDIAKYLSDKIELIEKNFKISSYKLRLTRGVQSLQLISDKVTIADQEFYKSFYILNSSDKSRRLSFNLGLYCQTGDFYMVGVKNFGLNKLHLTGVTQAAEEVTGDLDHETFQEQLDAINSLIGHQIAFSKIREVILGEKADIPQINHRKFDAFKNTIRFYRNDGKIKLSDSQYKMLSKESGQLSSVEVADDFVMDAFVAFKLYLRLFNRQDSHVIKTETDRIMKMTKWAIRNKALESLGI